MLVARGSWSAEGSLLFLLWVGGVVLQGSEDGLGNWGRRGQVGALWLESVLVGDVLQGDGRAVGGGVLEVALCLHGLGSLQVALFAGGDAVLRLVAEISRENNEN